MGTHARSIVSMQMAAERVCNLQVAMYAKTRNKAQQGAVNPIKIAAGCLLLKLKGSKPVIFLGINSNKKTLLLWIKKFLYKR